MPNTKTLKNAKVKVVFCLDTNSNKFINSTFFRFSSFMVLFINIINTAFPQVFNRLITSFFIKRFAFWFTSTFDTTQIQKRIIMWYFEYNRDRTKWFFLSLMYLNVALFSLFVGVRNTHVDLTELIKVVTAFWLCIFTHANRNNVFI